MLRQYLKRRPTLRQWKLVLVHGCQEQLLYLLRPMRQAGPRRRYQVRVLFQQYALKYLALPKGLGRTVQTL